MWTEIVPRVMLVFFLVMTVMVIMLYFLMSKVHKLERQMAQDWHPENRKDIERVFGSGDEDLEQLSDADWQNLISTTTGALTRIGLVHYDAFDAPSSHRSYSLCVLNEEASGFILTSIATRERSYSYCKLLRSGQSDVLLSEDEKKAFLQAQGQAYGGDISD